MSLVSAPELEAWRKAVLATDALKGIQAESAVATGFKKRRYHRYPLKPEELWARSYAQFIASDPSAGPIAVDLAKAIAEDTLHPVKRQWAHEDFAPVAHAIQTLFKTLGCLC